MNAVLKSRDHQRVIRMKMVGKDASQLSYLIAKRPVERICVIKPSAFGDVVQAMPLLNVLRTRFPESQISWVINRELTDLLVGHPANPILIPFDRRGGPKGWWRLLSQLRQSRFDLLFDLQGLFRTAVMNVASAASLRVGLQTAREGSRLSCHAIVPNTTQQVPANRRYWRIAEELGLTHAPKEADIFIPQVDLDWATNIKKSRRGPLLIVHPGGRWETKLWPARNFSHVILNAMRELKMSVIVIGSRNEALVAQQIVETVQEQSPGGDIFHLAGETSIKQLAALMKVADLVLSNDSGPMHLADAMGAPVIGVFTCTNPIRSGPGGSRHRLISAPVPCAGSYCKRCPNTGVSHLACFRELTPTHVWNVLRDHWTQSPNTTLLGPQLCGSDLAKYSESGCDPVQTF